MVFVAVQASRTGRESAAGDYRDIRFGGADSMIRKTPTAAGLGPATPISQTVPGESARSDCPALALALELALV